MSPEDATPKLTFEEALRELEQIAGDLESGRLGLSEALGRYEKGMGFLRHCHELLADAERRIEVLTRLDEQGQISSKPFNDDSLTQKLDNQTRPDTGSGDVDGSEGLF